jgi:hypothetical protein
MRNIEQITRPHALRIQRRRVRGYTLPDGAVYVGRPSIWGNPWSREDTLATGLFDPAHVPEANVLNYFDWLTSDCERVKRFTIYAELEPVRREILRRLPELSKRPVACWCGLDEWCHGDVLCFLSNEGASYVPTDFE